MAKLKNPPQVSSHVLRYLHNTSWLFFERIFRILLTAVVGFYVARYLGPTQFGVLNYGLSFVVILSPIAASGISGILVKWLIDNPSKTHFYVYNAFILKLVSGAISFVILIICLFFFVDDPAKRSIIFLLGSNLLLQSFTVVDSYFQSRVLSKFTVIGLLISVIFSSALKIVFIQLHYPVIYIASTYVVENIILAIMYLLYYFRKGDAGPNQFSWDICKQMLKQSWPYILSGFVIIIYMKIDQIMIDHLLGDKPLGNYSAAVKISEAYYFLPLVICGSLFPAILSGKSISQKVYHARLLSLYSLFTWIALSFSIFISFFANDIAQLLYGSKYQGVGPVLSLHIWSGLFVFWGTAIGKWVLAEGIQRYETVNTVLGAVINVALNFVLIPSLGIIGAAWATLIAYGFAGLLGYSLYPKTRLAVLMVLKSFNPKFILKFQAND